MADEETDAPVKAKSNKMILVLVLLNVLGLGGVGAYVVFGRGQEYHPPPPKPRVGPLVALEPLIVNLNDTDAGRYVKLAIQFELRNEQAKPLVEAVLIPIRSRVISYFGAVRVSQTQGNANINRMLLDIKQFGNEIAGKPLIVRAYFTEFVVQ